MQNLVAFCHALDKQHISFVVLPQPSVVQYPSYHIFKNTMVTNSTDEKNATLATTSRTSESEPNIVTLWTTWTHLEPASEGYTFLDQHLHTRNLPMGVKLCTCVTYGIRYRVLMGINKNVRLSYESMYGHAYSHKTLTSFGNVPCMDFVTGKPTNETLCAHHKPSTWHFTTLLKDQCSCVRSQSQTATVPMLGSQRGL